MPRTNNIASAPVFVFFLNTRPGVEPGPWPPGPGDGTVGGTQPSPQSHIHAPSRLNPCFASDVFRELRFPRAAFSASRALLTPTELF